MLGTCLVLKPPTTKSCPDLWGTRHRLSHAIRTSTTSPTAWSDSPLLPDVNRTHDVRPSCKSREVHHLGQPECRAPGAKGGCPVVSSLQSVYKCAEMVVALAAGGISKMTRAPVLAGLAAVACALVLAACASDNDPVVKAKGGSAGVAGTAGKAGTPSSAGTTNSAGASNGQAGASTGTGGSGTPAAGSSAAGSSAAGATNTVAGQSSIAGASSGAGAGSAGKPASAGSAGRSSSAGTAGA
jgi:hypothetical protein